MFCRLSFTVEKAGRFSRNPFEDYKKIKELIKRTFFNPTKRNRKSKGFAPEQKTLNILTKKIRNGIAHQQVECVDRRGKWVQVTIRDFNKANGDNLELELTWTIRELKEFSLFISDKYIEEINKIKP